MPMKEGRKFGADPSFDAFISNVQHEARKIGTDETLTQHIERLLSEVDETINEHRMQSPEEAVANLAKLDIIIEVVNNLKMHDGDTMKAKAKELKADIMQRYPTPNA